MSLYAVAFGLMLGGGGALAASSLGSLRSIGLLRLSIVLSLAATLLAVAGAVLPRRR